MMKMSSPELIYSHFIGKIIFKKLIQARSRRGAEGAIAPHFLSK